MATMDGTGFTVYSNDVNISASIAGSDTDITRQKKERHLPSGFADILFQSLSHAFGSKFDKGGHLSPMLLTYGHLREGGGSGNGI